jgi:hypothetical protein
MRAFAAKQSTLLKVFSSAVFKGTGRKADVV